jgi:hypothetical protein
MDICEQLAAAVTTWNAKLPPEEQVNRFGDVRACILSGLLRAASESNWLSFNRYVLAAFAQPDHTMTGILCEVLNNWQAISASSLATRVGVPHREDMVELLRDIGDPFAVSSLEQSIGTDDRGDDYRQFTRKCLWALSAIGTPDALEAIHRAAQSDDPIIREYASEELEPESET